MQTFKDTVTGSVWAFDDDVVATADASGAYSFKTAAGEPVNAPATLQPYVEPAAAAPTLADVQAAQNGVILAAAQAALAGVVAAYPDLEVATWPQQLAEATAYTANANAATPMLSAIAAASGNSVAALAANIMAKAVTFQDASGAVIGKRIALMDQIAATTTVAAAEAVIW